MLISFFFFFNDTATTEIYTLSLHDALPICDGAVARRPARERGVRCARAAAAAAARAQRDRKSTRLNSSHSQISYAVFCLKKKKKNATNYALGWGHADDIIISILRSRRDNRN